MKSTDVKESLISDNEATVPSGPVETVGQPGGASDQLIPKKPEGLPADNSKAIKPSLKRGSSSGLNTAGAWNGTASAAAKGKSIVTDEVGKVAWFQCTATIDDVVHGAGWYYIGCRVCHTKAIKGLTTLMCKKCGKNEIQGVPLYHSKLSVYDHKDQAVFVVLGAAGEELTGKKAAELVDSYYEVNEIEEEDHIVPVPQALIGTIGQTKKFVVMVSAYNLSGKSQALTVTKVLHLDTEDPEANIGDAAGEAPENGREDHAEESVKRGGNGIECEGAKRTKHG
ncbi:unnamed protein product [Eruca vesicaria subsp. sativa]|uniref:Replication factor A C-terminal domain-containing protein n=1 Tax=Eruca vesicaria subsp. sativa TaxID=29727 RepID=A0ABC8JJ69_ERUVS|nr:unnamed protein product [Eruca vesicaria subsp. sativa]